MLCILYSHRKTQREKSDHYTLMFEISQDTKQPFRIMARPRLSQNFWLGVFALLTLYASRGAATYYFSSMPNYFKSLITNRGTPALYASCEVRPNIALEPKLAQKNSVTGQVVFRQQLGKYVEMQVNLKGFDTKGSLLHGYHVHEFGDLSNGCESTGAHYNPFNQAHGAPDDTIRHVGDFGNLKRDESGAVHTEIADGVSSLFGYNTVIGRAIVIHANEDDLGDGGNPESLATGNAGARLACCVIGVASEKVWKQRASRIFLLGTTNVTNSYSFRTVCHSTIHSLWNTVMAKLFWLGAMLTLYVSHGTATCSRTYYNSLFKPQQIPVSYAYCEVRPNKVLDPELAKTNSVTGQVVLRHQLGRNIEIKVDLTGFDTEGSLLHGFHIHELGDLSNGCDSTGSHFNPFGQDHGAPDDIVRHVGDLGNLERDGSGSVSTNMTDGLASLWGYNTIFGRAFVIHADEDDLGKGGTEDSLTTGNAGSRLACCVIGRASEEVWN
ncbi:uncharacterized protein LOC117114392 [Anneissia japonica]|uniref:uncharacterized protein LOC117114392 n=1 Tax=Anneissia japonica TaxID=1529436 RepID=UPI001425B947|nr:uncharacterized protein LOC117114392 [Anneissia japonica]